MTEQTSLKGYAATLEAIIFASDKPVRERELRYHIPDEQNVDEIIEVIQQRFDASCGIELRQVGDGWAFRTRAEIADRLNQHKKIERPLSRAALEVLAIIAYHQPITRAEIEEIRGISLSKGTMDILLELTWIKPLSRRRTPGRPLTWGTSLAFLDHFGLENITDLPGLDELRSAGLLHKRQILGELMENPATNRDDDPDEEGNTLLDNQLLESATVDAELRVRPSVTLKGDHDEEGLDA